MPQGELCFRVSACFMWFTFLWNFGSPSLYFLQQLSDSFYLFLMVLGLHSFTDSSLVTESGGSSCHVQASLCTGFSCCCRALECSGFSSSGPWGPQLWRLGSRAQTQWSQYAGLVSLPCGIFPDQGLNLCLLHWQADSSPLSHQGSPCEPVTLRTHHKLQVGEKGA